MIVLTNNTEQTIEPGAAAVFSNVIFKNDNSCKCNNDGRRPIVRLGSHANYLLSFTGNITAGQLTMYLGGTPLPETEMISAAATAQNVSALTAVSNPCCGCETVTVVNTGAAAVTLSANPALVVIKIS